MKSPAEVRIKYYEGVQKGECIWTVERMSDNKSKLTYSINLSPNESILRLLSNIINFSKLHSNAMNDMFKSLNEYLLQKKIP